jgi:uncharacterized membrane protein
MTAGEGIAWNGTRFVAVGQGTNCISHSLDGLTWTGIPSGATTFTIAGHGIAWNGIRFVAVGEGTNCISHSLDGLTWTGIPSGTTTFTGIGFGVASNPRIGATIVDSQMLISANRLNMTSKLDIVSDSYYNTGFTELSVSVTSRTLT